MSLSLFAYTRVSTADQVDSGLSMEAQYRAITGWASAMGHTISCHFRDGGVSAKTLERPGLEAALINLHQVDGLVVVKLDRLTRSVRDFVSLSERFEAEGKALVSIRDSLDTTTATGRLMANLIASVAQWEREVISERTKEALATLKANGVKLGRPSAWDEAARLQAIEWWNQGHTISVIASRLSVSESTVRRAVR